MVRLRCLGARTVRFPAARRRQSPERDVLRASVGSRLMTHDVVADALEVGAATLGESGARRMHRRVKPAWTGARVAGPAFTVRCSPGDNLAIHVAVTRAPAGSVLVADMGGEREYGYWREVLTTAAEVRGIAGLVIDACVR